MDVDRLEHHKDMIKEFYHFNKYIFTEQMKDSLLDAISCMEKQIPKIPTYNVVNINARGCPMCKTLIKSLNYGEKYCSKCGQLLDWRKTIRD